MWTLEAQKSLWEDQEDCWQVGEQKEAFRQREHTFVVGLEHTKQEVVARVVFDDMMVVGGCL